MTSQPLVDVIVPAHNGWRPIERAVLSARSERQGVPTRVIVVLHNLTLDENRHRRLAALATVVRWEDEIPSPSGPRNFGLATATAPYVFFLDSDDELPAGCIGALHDVARETEADIVLPSIRLGERYLGTPPVWRRKRRVLDVLGDGLFMRAHAQALFLRERVSSLGATFPTGDRVGEDLVFMSQLYPWSRTALAFDVIYQIDDDSPTDRISTADIRPGELTAFVHSLLDAPWVASLSNELRTALARRLLAVNIAGGWRRRVALGQSPSIEDYRSACHSLLGFAPSALGLLSVRDRVVLRFSDRPSGWERILVKPPLGVVPTSVAGAVCRSGPPRLEARMWLVRHRRRRASEPLGAHGETGVRA